MFYRVGNADLNRRSTGLGTRTWTDALQGKERRPEHSMGLGTMTHRVENAPITSPRTSKNQTALMLFGWTTATHCGNHQIYKYCTITEQITVCLHRKAGGIHTGTIQQSFPRNSSLMGCYAILTGKQLPTLTIAYTSNQQQSASWTWRSLWHS